MLEHGDVVNEHVADLVLTRIGVCPFELLNPMLNGHMTQRNHCAADDDGGKARLNDRDRRG